MMTYSEENIEDVVLEIEKFFPAHKDEASFFEELQVCVDAERWKVLQNEGSLLCCVVRDGEKIVGYCIDVLSYSSHYKDRVFAHTDIYFLLPEYRARCGKKLFQFVEHVEQEMGVYARVTGYSKTYPTHIRTDAFLRSLGYSDLDVTLAKRL